MTSPEFVRVVRQAYDEMPVEIIRRLENVAVLVEEWPVPDEQDLEGSSGTLFGLYIGVPVAEREGGDPVLPDRIEIYRQPILRNCSSRAEAELEIKITLWHEIGHYLGLSEEALRKLNYG